MFDWALITQVEESAPEERWPPSEAIVIAWINSNPPDLPDPQNNCAACGLPILVIDAGWVYLADGAMIHYSGKHEKICWERWLKMRRSEAMQALAFSDNDADFY